MKRWILAYLMGMTVLLFAENRVPVMIGGEAEEWACSALGKVRGLDPDGDGFLAVRRGPGSQYAMIDKLHNGDMATICDERGKWIGIVYGRHCGLETYVAKRRAYRGPCRSGWVYGKWLRVVGG